MGVQEKRWLPEDTSFYKLSFADPDLLREAQSLNSFGSLGRENELRAAYSEAYDYGISATLIVAGSDSRSLHRPQVCLGAQGWRIGKREVMTIETSGGDLEVMNFHLAMNPKGENGEGIRDKNGDLVERKANYFYWWIGPDATTASDEKRVWIETWRSILKGRRERWAYPSVMVYVNPAEGEEASTNACERAISFISEVAPGFQKSLGAKEREGTRPLKPLR